MRIDIKLFYFALFFPALYPLLGFYSTQPVEVGVLYLVCPIIYFVSLATALLITFILLVMLFFKNIRSTALKMLVPVVIFIPISNLAYQVSSNIQMFHFVDFCDRSVPLIRAIENYEKDKKGPPQYLRDLVPDYIEAVPNTGMSAYSSYDIASGYETVDGKKEKVWILSAPARFTIFSIDQLCYKPNKDYSEFKSYGMVKKVCGWVFVKEVDIANMMSEKPSFDTPLSDPLL